ncbi:hypothetical protein L1987_12325 [Smallanthus sonchifolius]|uniref:Uncharacterized protein n=2 Tax=Smallanthus sonchifolius TaxID=185202 RepID=A0ACB9JFL0_9ASTR|nr:hypothetical protein L1987_56773 [Smallanthus sonchifolius]KAI3818516.1 hypothetical protein L1987_12325 [Smallanthus sonchifolius]
MNFGTFIINQGSHHQGKKSLAIKGPSNKYKFNERGIKMLHFKHGGINSIIKVSDFKDMPKRELRVASNHILSLFQDDYLEMVARKVLFNLLNLHTNEVGWEEVKL